MKEITLLDNAILFLPDGSARPGALAFSDDKILAVGDRKEVWAKARPSARSIDLDRAMILPGLHDGHSHMMCGALALSHVNLRPARSREEFVEIVKAWLDQNPAAPWILGGQWDDTAWGGRPPDKDWVDEFTADRPLYLTRYDMHSALINSKTLKILGITADTPDPLGGKIVRYPATGQPTGLLVEQTAMNLVLKEIPEPSEAKKIRLLRHACQYAQQLGLTRIQDIPLHWKDISAYRAAMAAQLEGVIIHLRIPVEFLPEFRRAQKGKWPGRMVFDGIKAWTDGSLGSSSAWLRAPYVGQQDNFGVPWVTDLEGFKETIKEVAAADIPVSIHGIGDASIGFNLDCFYECINLGLGTAPLRIEHFQHPAHQDIERTNHPRLVISIQPLHLRYDAMPAEEKLGPERAVLSFPIKTLMSLECNVVFGSDWPVADLNPFMGIHAAVTRLDIDGKYPDGWQPAQKINVTEAIGCYTWRAAKSIGLEGMTGELKPGLRADLTVIDRDLTSIPPDKIPGTKTLMTVVGGQTVYQET